MKNYDERVTKMETNKIEISEAEFMRAISHVMTESKIAELTKVHFTLGLSRHKLLHKKALHVFP